MRLYDCNYTTIRYLYIGTTSSTWTGTVGSGSSAVDITLCMFENDFDIFDDLDIDNDDNVGPYSIDEPVPTTFPPETTVPPPTITGMTG